MASTNVKILFSPVDKLREIGNKISSTTTTTTTTITTRTTATRTTTPPMSECEDNEEWINLCSFFARHVGCRGQYEDFMRKNCAGTCLFC